MEENVAGQHVAKQMFLPTMREHVESCVASYEVISIVFAYGHVQYFEGIEIGIETELGILF